MLIDILSFFEEYFEGPFRVSILKRAIENGFVQINHTNIRDFSKDKHKKVDDKPFGGGPGMLLAAQPIDDAIKSVKKEKSHTIYLSPQGKKLTAKRCAELAKYEHLILVCGHYEGMDHRVVEKEIDEEISIGDYVLTNGCLPAIVLVDAVVRFIPGVLGHSEGVFDESFQKMLFEAPQYTRPDSYKGMNVPDVLREGNHKKIDEWKMRQSINRTRKNRPDLFKEHLLKYVMKKKLLEE